MKTRVITIQKQKIYDEIQSVTFKYSETALDNSSAKTSSSAMADMDMETDDVIIKRAVEGSDSRLRDVIRESLAVTNTDSADNALDTADSFTYTLSVTNLFNDSLLDALAAKIHQYLVWGGLYKWYLKHGVTGQVNVYKTDMDDMEKEILDMAFNRTQPTVSRS